MYGEVGVVSGGHIELAVPRGSDLNAEVHAETRDASRCSRLREVILAFRGLPAAQGSGMR